MRKAHALLLLLALFMVSGPGVFSLYAQERDWNEPDDGDIPFEPEWDWHMPDLYSRGDQTFTITLGVIFPAFFRDYNREFVTNNFSTVGGAGSLAYTHFLSSNFFLGGEIGGQFNGTLARNMIFFIPIGLRSGWQFVFGRFELPLTLATGVVFHRLLTHSYAGLFVRAGASVFYRFSPEWSFGLNTDWHWYPQWIRRNDGSFNRERSINGNIISATFSARYHF